MLDVCYKSPSVKNLLLFQTMSGRLQGFCRERVPKFVPRLGPEPVLDAQLVEESGVI